MVNRLASNPIVDTIQSARTPTIAITADVCQNELTPTRTLSLVSLNVEGLWRIANQFDIGTFAESHDFILLVETFTKTVPDSLFPSHKVFDSPGVKVSDSIHGRLSGGVVFLVKNELCSFVERVDIETDNIIVLKLAGELTGLLSDCVLIGAYLPPENAKYYEETDIYNGVSLLEDCLLDVVRVCGDLPLIVCGEFKLKNGYCQLPEL